MSFLTWLQEKTGPLARKDAQAALPLSQTRFLVVDVDVTGVDIRRDDAIGLAVLPVDSTGVCIDDLVYCPLVPPAGGGPAEADWRGRYDLLAEAMSGVPLATCNPRFVQHMLGRAVQRCGLTPPAGRWVDLELAVHGVMGGEASERASTLSCQDRMGIHAVKEHDAVADVFALAQLLQIVLAYSEHLGIRTLDALESAHKARRWLGPGR